MGAAVVTRSSPAIPYGKRAVRVPEPVTHIAVDGSGSIYVWRTLIDEPEFTLHVFQEGATEAKARILPAEQANPVRVRGVLRWVPERVDPEEQSLAVPQQGVPEERKLLLGTTQGLAVFGHRSESITVFDSEEKVLSKNRIQLDEAYAAMGRHGVPQDPYSGRLRVIWASGSDDGRLYVCSSELPVSGPVTLGVFDPITGVLVSVPRLTPPVAKRPRNQINTREFVPTMGAVGDQTLVLDVGLGLAALYPLGPKGLNGIIAGNDEQLRL
jgi:hypothetical protein